MSEDNTEIMSFPCRFPIKAMGRRDEGFTGIVRQIVDRHAGPLNDDHIQVNKSRNGRFLAVTVTIEAQSKAQLDAIYLELTAREEVLMAL